MTPGGEVDALADRITVLLTARPRTFYDLLRALEDAEYRTILQAWGRLRESRRLTRDEEGHYLLRERPSPADAQFPETRIEVLSRIAHPLSGSDTPVSGRGGSTLPERP